MNYNLNSGYGQMLAAQIAASVGPVIGRIFVVMASSEPSAVRTMVKDMLVPDPDGKVRVYSTLEAAYDAATTNANDVILLVGNATHAVSTGIAWTKNRIHVIGMDGGDRLVQQGAKVQLSGAVDSAYVIKVTGVRNSFRNVKFIQASTHANALSVVQMGGEGTLYKNCSFVFGVNNNLGGATTFEVINGEDSGTFIDCTFGADTLLTTEARAVMSIDQVTSGQEFKSNIFRGCTWIISSSSDTATHIRLSAVGDILFSNLFDRCNFVASVDSAGGVAIAESVQTGTGTVKGCLAFSHPATFNSTDFSTATGGRNTAIQIVGVVTTAGTGAVGVTPTA